MKGPMPFVALKKYLIFLVFVLCGCVSSLPSIGIQSAYDCPLGVFQSLPGEHMSNPNEEVIRSRRLEGNIVNLAGWWPEESEFHVQFFSVGTTPYVLHELTVGIPGTFRIADLDAGWYCLKISSPGWQSEEFLVVLDPRLEESQPKRIVLSLGV